MCNARPPAARRLQALEKLKWVYSHWVPEERILMSNLWSAELAKLTANAMLAQRISSVNAISALCEATGADVSQVAYAIGMDSRIGPKFLQASVGFGGSCFQKDILNLCYVCETVGLKEVSDYWYTVVAMNDYQKQRFVERVISGMFNTVAGKVRAAWCRKGFSGQARTPTRTPCRRRQHARSQPPLTHSTRTALLRHPPQRIAIFGFAFKKDTGDTRETPAIDVCRCAASGAVQAFSLCAPPCEALLAEKLSCVHLLRGRPLTAPPPSPLLPCAAACWPTAPSARSGTPRWRPSRCSATCRRPSTRGTAPTAGPRASTTSWRTCRRAGQAGRGRGRGTRGLTAMLHVARRTGAHVPCPSPAAPSHPPPPGPLPRLQAVTDPYACAAGAHAICVLTEWDEFKSYDYQKMFDAMPKPAFIFDGRNILDHAKLREIGFVVYALGKPLEPFLQKNTY